MKVFCMNNRIEYKFKDPESSTYLYALNEYAEKYRLDWLESLETASVISINLDEEDRYVGVDEFTRTAIEKGYTIIIFDITHAIAKVIHHLRYSDILEDHEYEEISDLYATKLIFAKKPINE